MVLQNRYFLREALQLLGPLVLVSSSFRVLVLVLSLGLVVDVRVLKLELLFLGLYFSQLFLQLLHLLFGLISLLLPLDLHDFIDFRLLDDDLVVLLLLQQLGDLLIELVDLLSQFPLHGFLFLNQGVDQFLHLLHLEAVFHLHVVLPTLFSSAKIHRLEQLFVVANVSSLNLTPALQVIGQGPVISILMTLREQFFELFLRGNQLLLVLGRPFASIALDYRLLEIEVLGSLLVASLELAGKHQFAGLLLLEDFLFGSLQFLLFVLEFASQHLYFLDLLLALILFLDSENLELFLNTLQLLHLFLQVLNLSIFEGNVLLEVIYLGLQEVELLAHLFLLLIELVQNLVQVFNLLPQLVQILLLNRLLRFTLRLPLLLLCLNQSLQDSPFHYVEEISVLDGVQVPIEDFLNRQDKDLVVFRRLLENVSEVLGHLLELLFVVLVGKEVVEFGLEIPAHANSLQSDFAAELFLQNIQDLFNAVQVPLFEYISLHTLALFQ